ncbi:MAG: RecQ family ATP-dependent DNA helicase [Bacteroidota bacterium]|nr:RecQ family ATP-dependent DNA helicase [Bacteroidota bacterium]
MNAIAFIDTEIEPRSGKILDIGSVKENGNVFHKGSVTAFVEFIKDTRFVCGHNVFNHDIKYIGPLLNEAGIHPDNIIDTLPLSPLLFPLKPYHALLKDDKLQYEETNNPLNDAIKAKDLFFDEVGAFRQTDNALKDIYFLLLNASKQFKAFFRFLDFTSSTTDVVSLIHHVFKGEICGRSSFEQMISEAPVELAYCLSLIKTGNQYSITPPWVLKNYPDVERLMFLLRNKPCISGCTYCNQMLDAHRGLKKFFGFDTFRSYGGEPLQEKAVNAAIYNKSFLAVFPTGGGKSITFQVPALMSDEATRGLTVVISPLQSLMKDQVDNLEKVGITSGVTINGLLDPIERAKSFERVEDGSAAILYISPESLRSKTIERLLLGRKIARFVIDEAHCFSSWGQNFRVDYLYIGDFIRTLQDKKSLAAHIPVSCFTATAKPKVIEDICAYFDEKLGVQLELITSNASRTNLKYKVFSKDDDEQKYLATRDLIEEKNCPTIVYVSRTAKAALLAGRLTKDGLNAKTFHGKMDTNEKIANQNAFLSGEVKIMVATSAFGMGVDKKDVGMVIHYDISDSLENYVQEAGRAGRDESLIAECYVLFNEEDLSKHFILLNQTKLSIKEIQQVWKAIKDITRFRTTVSNSALEIARKAGWDDSVAEIETRVTTAIAALEDAGYLKRGQNSPRIFANSILSRNAQEATDKINASERFTEKQKEKATRIIKKLFSSKNRKQTNDEVAESRVDYISDHLGIVKEEVINIINLLREENILADFKDLTAFIKQGENKNRSLHIVDMFGKIEKSLLPFFDRRQKTFNIKELNEYIETHACADVTPGKIKSVINFWAIKHWIKQQKSLSSKYHFDAYSLHPIEVLEEKFEKRHQLAKFIVTFLFDKTRSFAANADNSAEILVEFSVRELKDSYLQGNDLFKLAIGIEDIEDALFYLSKIEAIKIEGGFLVVYNRLTIERTEQDNRRRYKAEDYQKLSQFYENKVQQIHIVGEYAQKMIESYRDALQFVDDYFQLNYTSFLNKYFKGNRQKEISQNITPAKFRQLFGELSPTQLSIIKDDASKYIVVAAGPGSGKTKVLVHKLASLLLMEDVKHEQLLMLTFSRGAATEFKKRLLGLIGNAANFVEIKTFHSYCFDLLGKMGSLEKSEVILKKTVEKIRNKEVEISRITKTVLVIDEAQDMNADEFELVRALIDANEDMRVIAVGDDDQNIYGFRGASSKYLQQLIRINDAIKYELVENYRSKSNLVNFANQLAKRISHRLKDIPIIAKQTENGKIKIVRYEHNNLITPLINDIINTPLTGTTCILAKTNDEALQITGVLLKNGMQAKLIQANDGFNLYDLLEIRSLLDLLKSGDQFQVITDDNWANAKRALSAKFKKSDNWTICVNVIKDFEATNTKTKYKSDLEVFIRESKLEDFYAPGGDTIFVSTIHKAKGKEFDNVFLMLENMPVSTDEITRQLYVAITRAKQNLIIHLNTNHFDKINADNMNIIEDHNVHSPPALLAICLTHKDIWLDHFSKTQRQVSALIAGDELTISNDECLNSNRQPVLKFSKPFLDTLETMAARNYKLINANVNFIVYWHGENVQHELCLVLPKLYFEKI